MSTIVAMQKKPIGTKMQHYDRRLDPETGAPIIFPCDESPMWDGRDRPPNSPDCTSPATFRAILNILFGEKHRLEAAAAFGVNERTIRRWCDCEQAIPEAVAPKLRDLLIAKSELAIKAVGWTFPQAD